MKKLISTLVIIVFLITSTIRPAQALVLESGLLIAVAGAALVIGGVAVTQGYYKNAAVPSLITTSASYITLAAKYQYASVNNSIATVQAVGCSMKADAAAVYAYIKSLPLLFPNTALKASGIVTALPSSGAAPAEFNQGAGDSYTWGGNTWLCTSRSSPSGAALPTGFSFIGGNRVAIMGWWGTITNSFTPQKLNPTPAENNTYISSQIASPTTGELYPTYESEVAQAVAAVGAVPVSGTPTRADNPPAYVAPAPATQDQINSSTSAAAVTAANTASNSAAAVLANAQAAHAAAPTAETQAAVLAAQAAYDAARANEAAITHTTTPETGTSSTSGVALKSIDFAPLGTLGAVFSGKFPFSLLSTVAAFAASFVSSPVTPSFSIDFPAPFNYHWTFNLSAWDTWAAVLRTIIGASFLAWGAATILRRWQ